MFRNALSLFRTDFSGFFCNEITVYSGGSGGLGGAGGPGGPGGPVPPSRGRGRGGPMTREELQKLREDELASQHNGKGRANTRLFNLFIIETKELSFCHELKFSNLYIFVTWWCTPLIFQTKNIWSNMIYTLKYLRSNDIGFRRYRDYNIRVCGKDTIPLYQQTDYSLNSFKSEFLIPYIFATSCKRALIFKLWILLDQISLK